MTEQAIAQKFVSYLGKSLAGSGELKRFIADFTDATVRWVRPLFLKDDEPLKQFEKLPLDELNQSEMAIKIAKELRQNASMKEGILSLFNKIENQNQGDIFTQQSTGDYSPVIGKIDTGGIGQQINNTINPPLPPKP
ncbi:MAG: hypothetical protein SGJ02_09845 [bacterium]|nr:hypothetical protein [bacterium]